MTIQELTQFIGEVIGQIMSEPRVRTWFLATTLVIMVTSFFTNHLTVKRLLFYAALFVTLVIGSEVPRMEYRIHVQNVTALRSLYTPVIFAGLFYACMWFGIFMGFLINKLLWITLDDPWVRLATVLERLAEKSRQRSEREKAGEVPTWVEFREMLERKSAEAQAVPDKEQEK